MNLQKTARHLLGALLLVLLAWQALLSLGGYSEALFPSPLATLQGLYELLTDGVLLNDIGVANGSVGGLALRAVDNPNNESRIAVVRSTALITPVKSQ